MPNKMKTEQFCREKCKYREQLSGVLRAVEYCRVFERILKTGLREGQRCAVAPKGCPFLNKKEV
jgi:hypothetical protein